MPSSATEIAQSPRNAVTLARLHRLEREAKRQPLRPIGESPLAVVQALHLAGYRLPRDGLMLLECRQPQARSNSAVTISPSPWFHSCVVLCAKTALVST